VPGNEGKCTAVKGKPTRGTCSGDADGVCAGACDGSNRAACTYPDVACAPSSCSGKTATIAPRCKDGTCPAATTQQCVIECQGDGCLGVKHLATGGYPGHACAAMTDGSVRCWGANGSGQAGSDPAKAKELNQPVKVDGLTDVTMVAATGGTSCALIKDGTVKCWGSNTIGQLGRGGIVDSNPNPVPGLVVGVKDATFIAGGSGGTFCAIVAGGEIECWGDNSYGELGSGSLSTYSTAPVSVCTPGSADTSCTKASGATWVFGGDRHTCAIIGGIVACWGQNTNGECGQDPTVVSLQRFPQFVTGNLSGTFLTAGNGVTCVGSAGGAKCFGGNGIAGRLGNCDTTTPKFYVPQSVGASGDCKTPFSGVTSLSTHDESVCGVSNGAVKCWGSDTGGQLGDGNDTGTQSYPATTAIPAGAVQVASGGGANYAVVVDGVNRDVRCWGSEANSQCGTGTPSDTRKTPVAVKW